MIKRITLLTLYSLFFSAQSHAWTTIRDFEDGLVGTIAQNNKSGNKDGFGGAAGSARYSTEHVAVGKQSSSTTIKEGATGFGQWGGSFGLPGLGVGDELWNRVYLYFPNGFDWTGGIGKGMRIHTRSEAGGNEGYIDIYFGENGNSVWSETAGGDFGVNNPGGPGRVNSAGFNRNDVGTATGNGRWVVYEQYVKFAADPNPGIYRLWQDGVLVFEDKKTYTLRTPKSEADLVLLFTFWNNSSPKTQSAWVDDIILTTERPSNTDSFGNPFIGVGDVEFTKPIASPNPPQTVQ